MKRTNRGFAIYTELQDAYGRIVRVQRSSSAEGRYCWLFCKNRMGEEGSFHLGKWQSFSPHLTPAQARRIAKALLRFADGKD